MAARRKRTPAIDFDAVRCVDTGHRWSEVYFGYADKGVLTGMPIRIVTCETCHSQRLDHVSWDGRVVARRYAPDDAYIDNARALGEFNERRMAVRKAKVEHLKESGEWGERDGQ